MLLFCEVCGAMLGPHCRSQRVLMTHAFIMDILVAGPHGQIFLSDAFGANGNHGPCHWPPPPPPRLKTQNSY